MVVRAQLAERTLPTPEVRGSNPVIGEFSTEQFNFHPIVNCVGKDENKEKEAGNGPLKNVGTQTLPSRRYDYSDCSRDGHIAAADSVTR